jgi:hypothetical protein
MVSQKDLLYFLIGMQFMIIATMSAKGYGIFLGMVAALISFYFLLLLCLFLVPARKGVSGTLIKQGRRCVKGFHTDILSQQQKINNN